MNTRLDSRGRMLIPKRLRNELGLEPGTKLEIDSGEGRIVLIPRCGGPDLAWEDGVLVFTGEATGDLEKVPLAQRRRRFRSAAAGVFKRRDG
jgi:AbrB family looped-hinge helix DNA binding protein